MKKNCLIFDLDGTLVDSYHDIADSVNAMLSELELPNLPNDIVFSYIGTGLEFLIKKSTDQNNPVFIDKAIKIFHKYYHLNVVNKSKLYPLVRETLEELIKNNDLFVLTNKNVEFSNKMISQLSLSSFFKEILGPPLIEHLKPDPDGIHMIIKKCNINSDVYMIGDNYTDIEAGYHAGVYTVFCEYGRGVSSQSCKPDFFINEFVDLKKIIQ